MLLCILPVHCIVHSTDIHNEEALAQHFHIYFFPNTTGQGHTNTALVLNVTRVLSILQRPIRTHLATGSG